MVVNTRMFLRQIHPMYDRTSLGYGGSEENAQSFERALVVTMFIQQNSDSLFLTWLSPWGDGLMPQPLQNWHPSQSMYQWWVSMLGVHGGCIDCSKMRQYCYFLCYIFPYIFSLNCCYLFISQDIHRIMQCKYLLWTLGDMWQNLDDERTNLSCIYYTIYFWDDYVKILRWGEVLASSELVTNQQHKERYKIKWIAFSFNLWAVLRTVAL